MKYLFITIWICFLIFGCKKQEEDYLSDYSYLLYGKNNAGIQYIGTCFFIRKGDSLFICTVNHIARGCDDNGGFLSAAPNKMQVYLPKCPKPLFIDITKNRETGDCKIPDYFIDTVNSYYNQYIKYSIEDFIKPVIAPPNTEKFTLFGYHPDNKDDTVVIPQPIKKSIIKKDFSVKAALNDKHVIDHAIYSIGFHTSEEVNMDLEGFSGCPAFVKDNTDSAFKFIGVFQSKKIEGEIRRIYITKGDYIVKRVGWLGKDK